MWQSILMRYEEACGASGRAGWFASSIASKHRRVSSEKASNLRGVGGRGYSSDMIWSVPARGRARFSYNGQREREDI